MAEDTLRALCRRIAPAAEVAGFGDMLVDAVRARITEMTPFNRARIRQAIRVIGGPALPLLLAGRPVPFAWLPPEVQDRVLQRCEHSGVFVLRLVFTALKRLIVNTWYGLPEARTEIGHLGALPVRAPALAWEGAIAGAEPVVASVPRRAVQTREVPRGVVETVAAPLTLRADVCIIGSGVGGSMAACRLSEAGRDVVILEAGPYRTAADYSFDENAALRDLYAEAGMRSTDDLAFSLLQGRCAGGGSTVNWMVMLRTPDHVLEEWARSYGVEDMSPAQMREVFVRFERESNVGAVAEHAHSRSNRLLLDGSRKLGWRVESANVNARECMRSGMCGLGCPYDAKQSALKTYLARALAAGATLYCETSAERITRAAQGWTVSARSGGHALTITARTIVMAAGAVETPALLQRSGLGNANVGRYLRLHPTTAVVGVYDEPVYAGSGIPLTTYCNEFVQLRGGYGHWLETPPLAAGLAAIAFPGFGKRHRDYMRQYPYLAPLIVLVRDGSPDDPSRGTVMWQKSGRARVDYRLSEADRGLLLHGMESAARIHFAMGAKSVLTLHRGSDVLVSDMDVPRIRAMNARVGDPMMFSAHVNGTCRMIGTASEGACLPDGALQGAPGIYVMDGSLLPTAPGVNPHETIAAVVDVLASRLIAETR
jgi:choline dehydrogenase-like flavoprotein